ncbi:MAG: Asp-tRNA(Asn)/Glu-tRNA(Gln) amidotransferase subunit GatC [Pseudomonadota bacterium]
MASSRELNVPHLARLARLSLDTEETSAEAETSTALAADLTNIMDMIDQMQAINTDAVEPMAHPLDATQRLRQDKVTESVDVDHFQAHAPATEDGFYLVPRVVE